MTWKTDVDDDDVIDLTQFTDDKGLRESNKKAAGHGTCTNEFRKWQNKKSKLLLRVEQVGAETVRSLQGTKTTRTAERTKTL
jgi:hypothetical protein